MWHAHNLVTFPMRYSVALIVIVDAVFGLVVVMRLR